MLTDEQFGALKDKYGSELTYLLTRSYGDDSGDREVYRLCSDLSTALLARRRDRDKLKEALKYLRLERWSTRYVPVQYCGYCGMRRNDGCKPDCRIDALFREDANDQD